MPRVALHAYDANDYIAARAAYARILWLRGYPDDAKTEAEQCVAEALEAGQEQSICWAIVFNICPVFIWRGDFAYAESLVNLLLERSQRAFEHYHEWGLLYRQFLLGAISAPDRAVRYASLKMRIPAQADLFVRAANNVLSATHASKNLPGSSYEQHHVEILPAYEGLRARCLRWRTANEPFLRSKQLTMSKRPWRLLAELARLFHSSP